MQESTLPMQEKIARRVSKPHASVLVDMVRNAGKTAGKPIISLGPGVPDYSPPQWLLRAASAAIRAGKNGYADSRGIADLRTLLANQFERRQNVRYNADTELTITAGAGDAMRAALLAVINPGDRVLVFEPYFEEFLPQIELAGGKPVFARLEAPDWKITPKLLSAAFKQRIKAVIFNSPHNPTGRVFSLDELNLLADFCRKKDALVLSDETAEAFIYGVEHRSIAALSGMHERTVTINSVAKTFNVSGWRIGNVFATKALTDAIRRVNGLPCCASPLQWACIKAMEQYESFAAKLASSHAKLRDLLTKSLQQAGFSVLACQGTYCLIADSKPLGYESDRACFDALLKDCGILSVPLSTFYRPGTASTLLRFCFAKKRRTLLDAQERLQNLKPA